MSLAEQQWCPTSVQVTVLQARGLRIKGKSGTNDAYAVMQVGKEKYQTSVVEKSVAPVWKEEAAFDLPPLHQGGGGERSTLRVNVLHRALVGPDKLLGQAVINLLPLSEDKTRNKTEWFKLLDKTGKADKDRGEVLVDIQFMRNNMTASMFDLSAAGKSRSRLGKFKDKVRGKKKESDTASTIVPSFTQVLTDSEGEGDGDGEVAAGKDEKKKKLKMKSLFSPKSNLQKNMSQSMSVLPAKNSSLSGSQSSGLNVDSSEGKKKFKFMIHKRSGSSDSKDSTAGQQKHGSAEQSNLCINGSHVYCEEPQPRTARIGSNFSLASSGHGSMEDVPESSPPSVDSLRAVRQYSPWTEEEEEEAEVENKREDMEEMRMKEKTEEMVRRRELERLAEEKRRIEEEERKQIEEKRRREEEERIRREEERAEEEERVRREEEERERLAEEKRRLEEQERRRVEEEEKLQREEEERIRMEEERALEERRRKEKEEERLRRQEEEHERLAEEKRRREEEERKRIEEEKARKEEEDRIRMEEERAQEERRRKEKEEEEERVKRQEEERERLAEEKRRREEEERKRIEEEKARKEEEDRIRMEEERVQEERRRKEKEKEEERVKRQEEERERLAEEKRREEEEERKRIEEEKARKEEEDRIRMEEERAQEERRRKEKEEEEERVKRQEEERERLAEEKRRQEEEEDRKRIEEEKSRKEEEERIRMEEERAQEERRRKENEEEEERVKRQEEERERLAEEKRRQEEEERRIEEEKARLEEEERIRREEERAQEEKRRQEEMARKEKEELERLAEEKRKLDEEERKRIEEEDRLRREEQERIRMEEEERQRRQEEEERARKEKEERERLAEERRLEEEGKRRIEEEEKTKREEEERIRMQEKAGKERKEKEAQELEKRGLTGDAEEQEKKENQTKDGQSKSPEEVTSTNPFEENFSNNPFDESSDSAAAASSVQQRCQSPEPSAGSTAISADEKAVIRTQREKRQAPQPPGRNQAERRSQSELDASTQHLAQINRPSKEKDVKTASVLPQRLLQLNALLSRSSKDTKNNQSLTQSSTTKETTTTAAKHTKRPAPSRPRSAEEEPFPEQKTSHGRVSEAKQVPVVYGLNPFDDDEDENELTAQDDITASSNTGSILWPPAVSQTHDKDDVSQTKIKSSKIARAPPPPAKTATTSSTLNKQNTDGVRVTDDTHVTAPDNSATQACDPEPKAIHPVPVQESPLQEPVTVLRAGEETGGKKEGPVATPRRLQPVKPLNPMEQQSVSAAQVEKDNKSPEILRDVQENTKVSDTKVKGPYSQLTQAELISLVLKQENQLVERDSKISELEHYIDNLLVRVMEEKPSILMSLNSLKKTV
ncbi:trichohyalin [Thunnus albacares]|uniref:trichohyalin n=1 Tax=Thunnus albacares TaxID=8236 RepID=UPI001CF6B807|nr:trichohyalin [Thunnus albacares]